MTDESPMSTSTRSTRSDVRYAQRRLVSHQSASILPLPGTSADMSAASSTALSSPSMHSLTTSRDPKSSPFQGPWSRLRTPRTRLANTDSPLPDESGMMAEVSTFINKQAMSKTGGMAEKERETERGKWVVMPEMRFRRIWDVYMLVLLLYVVTVSVFTFSFLGILKVDSVWFWIERYLDVSFFVDLVMWFFTAYQRPDGVIETDRKMIRRRYLRSWFLVDAVATFPWDVLAMVNYGASDGGAEAGPSILLLPRYLRLLRLARLFRLLRILRVSHRFANIEVRLKIKLGYLRLATLFVSVVLISHWFACLFYYFGFISKGTCTVGENCEYVNWFEKGADVPGDTFGRYITSVYFAVYTITTIGYGDVVPENTLERSITIVMMIVGAAMFAYVISQVSNIQNDMNAHSTLHRLQMDQLTDFAKFHNLPTRLVLDIRQNFYRGYQRERVGDEKKLLESMSDDLRVKVLQHMYGDRVKEARLLRHISKDKQLGQVYNHLSEKHATRGECLYSNRDKANNFYIIRKGVVEIAREGQEGVLLRAGQMFGEEGLYFQHGRESTAKCVEDCDLVVVPREGVIEELESCKHGVSKVEKEETLKCWVRAIAIVEAQIRYANLARLLRKKGEEEMRKKGVKIGTGGERERGESRGLKNSMSALSLSNRNGVFADRISEGVYGETEQDDGDTGELKKKLEEKCEEVMKLKEKLKLLQLQLDNIVEGLRG